MKNMEGLNTFGNKVSIVIGGIGGFVISLLGGYSPILEFLLGAMAVDFVLGLLIGAFNKSPKTESGGLNSNIGFLGIVKKVGILVCVWIGFQVDTVFNTEFVRYSIIIGFLANEVISVTENLSILGVVKIDAVTKMIDILKSKTGKEE